MSKGKPIFSIESEQGFLGSILLNSDIFKEVKGELLESDFYSAKHKIIYSEIVRMDNDGENINHVTVPIALEEAGTLEDAGGFLYSSELIDMIPNSSGAKTFAKTLSKLSERRKVLAASLDLAELLKESDDPFSTISEFNLSLEGMRSNKEAGSLYSKAVRDSKSILDLAEPDYWIDDFLPKDSFSMIFGPSGQFKSFIAMDIACSVATGNSYHGNDVEKAPVIYMTGEGQRSIGLRKVAWEIKNKASAMDLILLGEAIDMTSSSASSQLSEMVYEFERKDGIRPKLLIIDTLNRSFGGGDENSTQDMTKFVKSCDAFRAETGCDIIVIHHSGKDVTKGARGSSVLKAALDTEFSVARIGEDLRGRNVTLSCTKIKDGGEPPDLTFNMKQVLLGKKNKKGREYDSLVPELMKNPVESLVEFGGGSVKDIIKNLGSNATLANVVKEYKQIMPIGADQSQAEQIVKNIISASNGEIYEMYGKCHIGN